MIGWGWGRDLFNVQQCWHECGMHAEVFSVCLNKEGPSVILQGNCLQILRSYISSFC